MQSTIVQTTDKKTGDGDILQTAARTIGSTMARLAVATGLEHPPAPQKIAKGNTEKKKTGIKRTGAKARRSA